MNKNNALMQLSEIASRIKELRDIMGWNIAQMAEKTEVTEEQYKAYESGNIDISGSEPLEITFEWTNKTDVSNLCVRLNVYNAEKQPVATSVLRNFYSGKAGGKVKKTLRWLYFL